MKKFTFYDVLLDFILLDAFDDLENPPKSVVAVVQNQWLSNGFKETVSLNLLMISFPMGWGGGFRVECGIKDSLDSLPFICSFCLALYKKIHLSLYSPSAVLRWMLFGSTGIA